MLHSIHMCRIYLPNAGSMYINVRLTGFTCTWNIYLMHDKCTYMYALQDSYVQDVPI